MVNGPLPVDRHAAETSTDLASSMPWWVRAIAIIGIPGVLVIYLVYIGAQEVPAIRRSAERNGEEVLQNRELIRQHGLQLDSMYRMMQRLCSNTARSEEERGRCFDR
jgi:hypothetical protein